MSVDWHGDEARRHVEGRAAAFLTRAAITVARRAKELLSVAGTGKSKGKVVGPVTHSKPGQPPFKQTGRLRASVTYEVDRPALTARVGTNVDYGKILEVDRDRPWLKRALDETAGRVNEILGQIETD